MYQACYRYNLFGYRLGIWWICVQADHLTHKPCDDVYWEVESTFSLKKWQSIFMCLVLFWISGFDAMWSATSLLHASSISLFSPNSNSFNSCLIYMSSHAASAIIQYSASALDLPTTFCFLLFQDTKVPPSPPTRTQSIEGDSAQAVSASTKSGQKIV